MIYAEQPILSTLAALAKRTYSIGMEQFLDVQSEFPIEVGASELRREQSDHASAHFLICTPTVPLISLPEGVLAHHQITNVLLGVSIDIYGVSTVSLPSTMPRLRVATRDGGDIATVSDSSANVGAYNTRHALSIDLSGTPVSITPGDPLMIEFRGPYGGGATFFKIGAASVTLGYYRPDRTRLVWECT